MRDNIVKGRELSKWEMERKKFFTDRGVEVQDWERLRVEGRLSFEELIKMDKIK